MQLGSSLLSYLSYNAIGFCPGGCFIGALMISEVHLISYHSSNATELCGFVQTDFLIVLRESPSPSFLSYPSYNGIVVLFGLMFSNSTCTFLTRRTAQSLTNSHEFIHNALSICLPLSIPTNKPCQIKRTHNLPPFCSSCCCSVSDIFWSMPLCHM